MSLDARTLYETQVDAVFAFLSKLGLRGADLEDSVHDTFVTALSRSNAYDTSRPVRPWLLGIAFRVLVARTRRFANTLEVLEDAPEREDSSANPEQTLEEKRRLALFRRAVGELSEEQATVLVLHDVQGLGAQEIAESMGAPVATTYSRLRLARQNFAAAARRLRPQEAA